MNVTGVRRHGAWLKRRDRLCVWHVGSLLLMLLMLLMLRPTRAAAARLLLLLGGHHARLTTVPLCSFKCV